MPGCHTVKCDVMRCSAAFGEDVLRATLRPDQHTTIPPSHTQPLDSHTTISPTAFVRNQLKFGVRRSVELLCDDPVRVDGRACRIPRRQGGQIVGSIQDRGRHAVDRLHLEAHRRLACTIPGVVHRLFDWVAHFRSVDPSQHREPTATQHVPARRRPGSRTACRRSARAGPRQRCYTRCCRCRTSRPSAAGCRRG